MTKEAEIENNLIRKLEELKYTYRPDIRTKEALEANFRQKFQSLNRCNLTDSEFARLRDEIVHPDVFNVSKRLRTRETFFREDGTPLQYSLVNLKEWCKNEFEVVNQLRINTSNSHHRYDVILLVNGLPLVQIELKSLDVTPRKAMQQIVDYKSDAGNGYTNSLLCFMQLFIVSNQSNTRYFTNNNSTHFNFDADEQFLPVYQWAREDNSKVHNLFDFSDVFLSKCKLAEMISKYMVLVQSEQKMLMMRPYQIYAVKAIVDCIHQGRGNGYIWHTTGSGKTLTSFKASTLLKENADIEKCLFVVDRKDLDRQTREEFNKFQDGCVEANTNTETLVRRLLSDDYADKVIVTTIQKLGLALDENSKRNKQKANKGVDTFKDRLAPLADKRVVFIFDECHRSQFGENHKAIKKFFPKAQLFGFTGTPIFQENSTFKQVDGTMGTYVTTDDIFQQQLHNYTITHAIEDRNVLPFHIDYFESEDGVDAGTDPHRKAVVKAILDKHDTATHNRRFNTVFATARINEAIDYYNLFKKEQAKRVEEDASFEPLNIVAVFSPPAAAVAEGDDKRSQNNVADVKQLQSDLKQEEHDNKTEPEKKKKALIGIIDDYNTQYKTNHSIYDFDNYYQDVQERIKFHKFPKSDYPRAKRIDLIIVVDMLLTGFDSKYLNTLYVDKNLTYHSLIQAFSRTNRILNDTKPYGNILDFRGQEDEVDKAITRFADSQEEEAKTVWLVDPAPKVIEKYEQAVDAMSSFMNTNNLVAEPQEVYNLKGDTSKIEFVNRFKEVQKLKTQLDQYTDLTPAQKETIENLMPKDDLRQFRSSYLEIAKQLRKVQDEEGEDAPPEVQQLDFELVLFSSAVIDYDYIMGLMADYTQPAGKEKMSPEQLVSLLSSDAKLMNEREDLTAFIRTLKADSGLSVEQIKEAYQLFKLNKYAKELAAISRVVGLPAERLERFVKDITDRMIFDGEALTDLLEPLDLGWKARREKELELMDKLVPLLKKQAEGREISGLKAYE